MFELLKTNIPIIFDRTHLGELVYAPTYRDYSGDYVLNMEAGIDTSNCRLILLTTSDLDVGVDDGGGFDWSKRKEEQEAFMKAFDRSHIADKVLIDVHNGHGDYNDYDVTLAKALRKGVQTKKSAL